LLRVDSISDFLALCYHGLPFDTTAILYVNLLFIVISILPNKRSASATFQKWLRVLYFTTNLIAYATNFVDFIYYKFTYARTTTAIINVIEHEVNLSKLFLSFIVDFWYVFLLFFVFAWLWFYLYGRIKIKVVQPVKNIPYYSFSALGFFIIAALIIGGIRGGDFKKSTRPINLLDANRHVKNIVHADIVLNTPFAIFRTLRKNSFIKTNYQGVTPELILQKVQPIKQYKNNEPSKPNIVLMILESNGREYYGSFNKKSNIANFKSYTPFLDSLAHHSLIYTNAYTNGRQSIHGMSSVIAGIPSFKDAFTSSPYPKQKIESLVSVLESEGYSTSFFHGAANGSMGFLGFSNILGIDKYYGRT
ncbi:MAG: LTA synthase family protein, partial [Bacteroidota bacterium]